MNRQLLFVAYPQRFIELPACLQDVGYPSLDDGHLTEVAQAGVDRQLLFGAYPQRFVEVAARHQDVGDTAKRDRELMLVATCNLQFAQLAECPVCGVEVACLPSAAVQRRTGNC